MGWTMIRVTERARGEFRRERARLGKPDLGIQISFLYGCGGAGYRVSFTDQATDFDVSQESGGIPIFLDRKSYEGLAGAVIDYRDGEGGGFILEHPDAVLVEFC